MAKDKTKEEQFHGASLIAGAYSAAGGGIEDVGLAGAKAWGKMSKSISEGMKPHVQLEIATFKAHNDAFNQYMDAKAHEFEMASSEKLNQDEAMTQTDRDAMWKQLRKEKRQYLLGGKKKRAELTAKIGKWKAQHDAANAFEQGGAVSGTTDQTSMGNNFKRWLTTPEGETYINIMKGNQQRVTDPNNPDSTTMGYMVDDGQGGQKWVSVAEFEKLVNSKKFDQNSNKIIGEIANMVKTNGENAWKEIEGGAPQDSIDNGGYDFNYDDVRGRVVNEIVNKANIGSLVYDEQIPGRTFYHDIQERLMKSTYKDLGIEDHILNRYDDDGPQSLEYTHDGTTYKVDIDDGINALEAQTLADELIKDESMTKDYLADYFTLHCEKQWPNKKVNDRRTSTQTTDDSGVKGGEMVDGVYTPGEINPEDYDNISFGGKSMGDMLREAKTEEEKLAIVKKYADLKKSLSSDKDGDGIDDMYDDDVSGVDSDGQLADGQISAAGAATAEKAGEVYDANKKNPPVENAGAYQPSLSDTQVKALNPIGIQSRGDGSAGILRNGQPIKMKIEQSKMEFQVKGVSAKGESIMIDMEGTDIASKMALAGMGGGSQSLGQFVKQGDKYVWKGDKDNWPMFKDKASADDKASMQEFIKLVESDPQYAEKLLGHIKGKTKSTLNGATLETV